MPRIPLVEHERPRILAVDFSKPEIEKLKSAGLSVQRAATGLYDQGKVCIPCSIQDVEIILFSCHKDALDNIADRPVSEESILEGPYFGALVEEVWNKYGWTIFFVKDGFSPESFAKLGISNLGVVEKDGYQFSPARYRQLLSYQNNNFKEKNTTFPKFKGQAVKINDSYKECIILQRFVKSAGYYILGIDSDEFRRLIVIFGRGNIDARWLITDEATDTGILALRFQHDFAENDPYQHYYGGIFILPDFGDHNIDVSLTLINEILIDFNPMIFSETKHGWLKDYRAHPVALIEQQKIKTLNDAIKEAEELDKTIEQLSDPRQL